MPSHVATRRESFRANFALVQPRRVLGLEMGSQVGLVATDVGTVIAGPGLVSLVSSPHVPFELLFGGITLPTDDAVKAGRLAGMLDPDVPPEPVLVSKLRGADIAGKPQPDMTVNVPGQAPPPRVGLQTDLAGPVARLPAAPVVGPQAGLGLEDLAAYTALCHCLKLEID